MEPAEVCKREAGELDPWQCDDVTLLAWKLEESTGGSRHVAGFQRWLKHGNGFSHCASRRSQPC